MIGDLQLVGYREEVHLGREGLMERGSYEERVLRREGAKKRGC
jgi:hypothetical protein